MCVLHVCLCVERECVLCSVEREGVWVVYVWTCAERESVCCVLCACAERECVCCVRVRVACVMGVGGVCLCV